MEKKEIIVLFGGESSEYEVSLRSSYSVLEALDKEKYIIYKIGITKEGKWYLFEGENEEIISDKWHKNDKNKPICVDFSQKCLLCEGRVINATLAFPVMHGEYGEDGRIQSVLELLGIRPIGPSSRSAFLCMDKHLCKTVAMREGIPVVPYVAISRAHSYTMNELWEELSALGGDLFVKPSTTGSSVGISHIKSKKELAQALKGAFLYSDIALIERAIYGSECEVALLATDDEIVVSEVGQIDYKADFYDYKTKYHSDTVKYKIPAKIPEECRLLCQKYAKELYFALGCDSLCRMDFFVTESEVYFNEVNAIPGFTEGSMYPMLMAKSGFSLSELVDALACKK